MNLLQDSESPSGQSLRFNEWNDLAISRKRELMIVQNLREGKDQEVDEYLNNVVVLVGVMIVIVIEVRFPSDIGNWKVN